MHRNKVKKLIAVNMAMNCIYADFKAFKKSINVNHSYATSLTKDHKLDSIRKVDTFFCWDKIQGYQIRITASHGFYGQAERLFSYLPIHSDISLLFWYACDYATQNSDSAYARSERAFTGS